MLGFSNKFAGAKLHLLGQHNSLIFLLEPLDSVLLGKLVRLADPSLAGLPLCDPSPGPREANVEIHSVDSSGGVVLDAEINVLADSEAKVSSVGEVPLQELVLLNLQPALNDLEGLVSTHGNVNGDLLVTPDSEGAHGVASLREHRLLPGELLEDAGGPGKTISALSDAAVQDKLVNLDVLHHILLGIGCNGEGGSGTNGERRNCVFFVFMGVGVRTGHRRFFGKGAAIWKEGGGR